MTEYNPRGFIRLTRLAGAQAHPDSKEYADLHVLAARMGYRLTQRTIREDVEFVVLSHSLGILRFNDEGPDTPDEAELIFNLDSLELHDIDNLEEKLPGFFQEILEEYGVEADLEMLFSPQAFGLVDQTISMVRTPGSPRVFRSDLASLLGEKPKVAPSSEVHSFVISQDAFEGLEEAPAPSSNEEGVATVDSAWLVDVESSLVKPDDLGAPASNQTLPARDPDDDPDWMKF